MAGTPFSFTWGLLAEEHPEAGGLCWWNWEGAAWKESLGREVEPPGPGACAVDLHAWTTADR